MHLYCPSIYQLFLLDPLADCQARKPHRQDQIIYARKMAAKAAMAVMAMLLPTVLAAPVKGVIGDEVAPIAELRRIVR